MDQPTDTSPPGPAPSAPPDGPPGPRRLRRRPDDGHVAGVCAGVAEYFAVDPVIVRIVAVVLLFSRARRLRLRAGVDLRPCRRGARAPRRSQAPIDRSDRATQVFGIALIVLAASVFWGGWWSPGREWFLPIGLVALGAWLLFRGDEQRTDPAPPTDACAPPPPPIPSPGPRRPMPGRRAPPQLPTPPPRRRPPGPDVTLETPTAAAPDATVEADATAPDATVEAPTAAWDGPAPPPPPLGATAAVPEPVPPPAPRRRRIVVPIVFGALLVWTGVAFLAGVTVQTGLAVAVLIVGAGFLLGAAVGGSRALIGPAVWLVLLLVTTTVLDIPLTGPDRGSGVGAAAGRGRRGPPTRSAWARAAWTSPPSGSPRATSWRWRPASASAASGSRCPGASTSPSMHRAGRRLGRDLRCAAERLRGR